MAEPLAAGRITSNDVLMAFPYGLSETAITGTNMYLLKVTLRGADLYTLLSITQDFVDSIPIAQVSGMTYRFDPSASPPLEPSDITVGGMPLDTNASYSIAMDMGTLYLANLLGITPVAVETTAYTMFTAMREYFSELGMVDHTSEGRIMYKGITAVKENREGVRYTLRINGREIVSRATFCSPLFGCVLSENRAEREESYPEMKVDPPFSTAYWVFPQDANPLGYLFGGRLMRWVIRSASIYSSMLLRRPVVIGYMGSFDFINPIRVGDMVSVQVSPLFTTTHTITAVFAGATSDEEFRFTTAAEMTFISIDESGKPVAHGVRIPSPTLEKELKEKIRTYGITAEDTFFYNLMSGAKLLEYVDQVATLTAIRYARASMFTASIDETVFLNPIRLGEYIEIYTRLNAVWRTSAEVEVWVFASDPIGGDRRLATHMFVSAVLVDRSRKLQSYAHSPEIYEEATKRKEGRIRRKKELLSRLS